jgi:hypothetical protein
MKIELFPLPEMAEFTQASSQMLRFHVRAGALTPDAVIAGRSFFTKESIANFIKRETLGEFRKPGRPRKKGANAVDTLAPGGIVNGNYK